MTTDPRTRPAGVKAPHGALSLEIAWRDGHTSTLPHDVLRGYCPCAGCQGHGGSIEFKPPGPARHTLELTSIEPVGNYALALTWGDGHAGGIYSFTYLRLLGDLTEAHGTDVSAIHPELPR
ncbi:MAG: DUF971 domain-containing protein [Polyangiaceae bacterium]|nr:DUF971 domain-containing protein [Polyangiaceae bacterium]MCW5790691.1 DUF971 domain-containing protein [Polyangiaceae bacterium]